MSARRLVLSVLVVGIGVLVFGGASALAAAPEAPEVMVQVPVSATTAVVHGVLDPGVEGGPGTFELGTYEFLYNASKIECEGEGKAPASPGISVGGGKEEVTEEFSGLTPNTQYTVCLLARNGVKGETTVGQPVTFTTALPPETPDDLDANPVGGTSVTLHGVLNPDNAGNAGSYEFLYNASATECQGGGSAGGGALGVKEEAVPGAEVSGLLPNTQYAFCLLARNEAGETALSSPVVFTTLSEAPGVAGSSVSLIGTTSATVSAQISTGGLESSYSVQYGMSTIYGSETAVASALVSGSTVSVPLIGLQPNTEYHFRFTATNKDGTTPGVDVVFTTYPVGSGGLPDGRVVEQVSHFGTPNAESNWPGKSVDGGIQNTSLPFEASLDGNAVTFVGTPSTGGSGRGGSTLGNEYLASRGPQGGWSQENIGPLADYDASYEGFSSDLSTGFISLVTLPPFVTTEIPREVPTTSEIEPYVLPYERTFDKDDYHPLFTGSPHRGGGIAANSFKDGWVFSEKIVGISADANHVLVESNDALIEGGGILEKELDSQVAQEVEEAKTQKMLLEEANIEHSKGEREAQEKKDEEAEVLEKVDANNELYVLVDGQFSLVNVSPEGRLVPGVVFGGSGRISADGSRIFWGDLSSGVVYVRENMSGGTPSTVQVSQGAAQFWAASGNGKYAFYTETGKLWRFDVEDGSRVELAGSEGLVQGVVGTNETGEAGAYVYFVAQEALSTQTNSAGQVAVQDENNLYVDEADPEHADQSKIVFIGSLPPGGGGDYLTPDGYALMFLSTANLTNGTYSDEGSEEAYVYDANDSSLVCASCRAQASGASEPNSADGFYTHRWISEDGNHVFFDSEAPLVGQDVNGMQDVYEWERDGTGTCTEEDGCVYLLSAGVEGAAGLLDASVSGTDVFFVARQRLTPEGQDEEVEVYDARVNGALTVAPPQCSGTGCQGIPASAPIFATPSSVTFNGVGNFPPSNTPVATKKRSLTRAQKLTRALKTCRQKHGRKARLVCESRARKLYGTKAKAKKQATKGAK